MAELLIGSICLSDIPKECIKAVHCKDGQVRKYLNIAIVPKKTPQSYTDGTKTRTYTHFVSCQPKQDERKEGVNYILGNMETYNPQPQYMGPTPEEINNAPVAAPTANNDDLPF